MRSNTFFSNAINETVTPFIRQVAEEVTSENGAASINDITKETVSRFNRKYEGVKINQTDARSVIDKLLEE